MIFDDFYRHPRVKALDQAGRHLFSYLCVCKARHYSGIYYVGVPDIATETGIPAREVLPLLKTLEEGPVEFPVDAEEPVERHPGGFGYLIEYDWERSLVWVRGMLKAQIRLRALNSKQKAGLSRYLEKFTSTELLGRFLRYYETVNIPTPKGYRVPHSIGLSGGLFPGRSGRLVNIPTR